MPEQTLSLCMITRDEEDSLERCLRVIRPIASEIIIVDTGSKDKTVEIASKFDAKIIHFNWNNNFSEPRNLAIKHAISEWILVLDADEFISKEDYLYLKSLINNTFEDAFSFNIHTYTDKLTYNWQPNQADNQFGHGFSGYEKSMMIRLFRNRKGIFFKDIFNEYPVYSGDIKIQANKSGIIIHHYKNLKKDSVLNERKKQLLDSSLKKFKTIPSDSEALLSAGIQYFENNIFEKAIKMFDKCLRYNSKNELALFYNGAANSKLGQIIKAEKNLKNLLEINPSANVFAMLGCVYMESGECEKAIESFNSAIKFDPDHLLAINNMGVIYTRKRLHQKSIETFRKAIDINPYFLEAKGNLAAEYERNADWLNAFNTYKDLLLSSPKSITPYESRLKTIEQYI